ncbi:MAG: prolyl oligopeptidase family serine peptidase [Bacteroidota bacterium]|nr:S9 family peptidase [Candidatus Kapabacteria bacterium]MDW8219895.1 prolyl oligopeptidase family serine peptidase [Bacteroidota bacterium]
MLPVQAQQQKASSKTLQSARSQTTGQVMNSAPLIDRKLFFGDPEISGAQLSPDGRFMSFLKPLNGTRNIWVKSINEPFGRARPITNDTTRPISAYFWSRDSKYILFVQDKGGDENFNIYAVDPAEAQNNTIPLRRDLTELQGVRVVIYALPKTMPDIVYIGLNDRDAAWHDLYKLSISTGKRTLLRKNTDRIVGWVFDNADNLRLALRSRTDGSTEILRVESDTLVPVYSVSVLETAYPVRFHKDNKRIYMITNKSDSVDKTRLILFDPATLREEVVEEDPLKRVDFGTAMFSDKTGELLCTGYEDERMRLYWKDKSFQADYDFLRKKLPNADIYFSSSTQDEEQWLIVATLDNDPGATYLFNRKSKSLTFQYRPRPNLPVSDLAPMLPIRYKSRDGVEIPAYVTLPKGYTLKSAKNLPLVVNPHGGPWARNNWGYDAYAQFLANRGYAVLQPNFRGSTGYGKAFLNAGNKQWGDLMQDDITYGVQYLINEGIVDSKRVGIMGASYGGYATLAGVTFTPRLYAAAVAIVAPSNLITLLNSIPPYWEAARTVFYERVGNPETPEGKKQLERQSPVNHADKIVTPLMIVQGANDPRVKKAEADQIVVALRDRQYPVEYLLAPDEGHGFARPVNSMAFLAAAEKFLARYLGGRYQESMPDDVAQRLKEIIVDVATVSYMPKKIQPSSGEATLLKPIRDLRPMKAVYKVSVEVGSRKFETTKTVEIRDAGKHWNIVELSQSPMGTATDEGEVMKGTLLPVRRSVNQGPVKIKLDYTATAIKGTMESPMGTMNIDKTINASLFADGTGTSAVLATLPLAEGYTTMLQNFDIMSQSLKQFELKVAGVENVSVPAGTFDAYRLEIVPANGEAGSSTIWIANEGYKVVKERQVLPQMNGAIVVAELLP